MNTRMRPWHRVAVLIAVAVPGVVGLPGLVEGQSAFGATTAIGQAAAESGRCEGPMSFVQSATGAGRPSYAVPVGMTRITSWSVAGGELGGSTALEVWRRSAGGLAEFTFVGGSDVESVVGNQLNTFALTAPIAVEPGDLLGLYVSAGSVTNCNTQTTASTGSSISELDVFVLPTPGQAYPRVVVQSQFELNVSATLDDGVPQYDWSGFFPPVANDGVLNVVKAGRVIPVKFSLHGDRGLDVIANGYPQVSRFACPTGTRRGAVEARPGGPAGSLRYDPSTDQYVYLWRTDKAFAGTCQRFTIRLTDGTLHHADFWFRAAMDTRHR